MRIFLLFTLILLPFFAFSAEQAKILVMNGSVFVPVEALLVELGGSVKRVGQQTSYELNGRRIPPLWKQALIERDALLYIRMIPARSAFRVPMSWDGAKEQLTALNPVTGKQCVFALGEIVATTGTPLHAAAQRGDLAALREALVADPDSLNAKDDAERSALHWAAMIGRKEAVKYLLELKANVNISTKEGMTPLAELMMGGSPEIAQMLIDAGASKEVRLAGDSLLHLAVMTYGNIDMVKYVIEQGLEVNAVAPGGLTPLHTAAQRSRGDVITLLIEKGAKVDLTTSFGDTPLHHALFTDNVEAAVALLEAGAAINVNNQNGMTPLKVAVERHLKDMVLLLRQHGGTE